MWKRSDFGMKLVIVSGWALAIRGLLAIFSTPAIGFEAAKATLLMSLWQSLIGAAIGLMIHWIIAAVKKSKRKKQVVIESAQDNS